MVESAVQRNRITGTKGCVDENTRDRLTEGQDWLLDCWFNVPATC